MKRVLTEKRAGFTLLEMITVVVIMGIMAAIAVPLMSAFVRGNKLEIAAQHISNTLSLARQTAIARRQKTYVYFDPATKQYWISETYPHTPDDHIIGKIHKLPDIVDFDPAKMPPDKETGQDYGYYVFKPTGQTNYSTSGGPSGGNYNFRIIDTTTNPNKYRSISVVNTTGRIKVSK